MTAPILTRTYPADNDIGIPVGIILYADFDRSIDVVSAANSIVLYGADFDLSSGPDEALLINKASGSNPFYLKSPGFKGIALTDLELVYIDLSTNQEVDIGLVPSSTFETDYGSAGIGHRLKIKPKEQLAPNVEYVLYIMGDPQSSDNGVGSRTVWDVIPAGGNSSDSGDVVVYGGYTRAGIDVVHIKITKSGTIGAAQYKWWYESEGESSAILGRVATSRYRWLNSSDGVQIRFAGSGFVLGDSYTFNVEPIDRVVTNTKITFTTNDGSYIDAPDSPSTPQTSEPPEQVLPLSPSAPLTDEVLLSVVSSTPPDGAYQMDRSLREFTLTFNYPIDPATITDSTISVYKYPVSGIYSGQPNVTVLKKTLQIVGDTLTIKI